MKRIKIEAIDWENILANHISDKELVYRICKEVSKHSSKKKNSNNPFRQLAKDINISSKKIYRCQINTGKSVQHY